jgi:hypoxanthine phosphoribosyltransferase
MNHNVNLVYDYDPENRLPQEVRRVYARAECLYSEEQINTALEQMAERISVQLAGSNPVILCVMLGALVTVGKLITRLAFPLQVDYLHISRYHGNTRGGQVEWYREPSINLAGRTVLIVDDILDEGHTLASIMDYCRRQRVQRVLSTVLVQKHHDRRLPGVEPDFCAFSVDERYVFGFGMDYKNHLRNIPGIYAIDER